MSWSQRKNPMQVTMALLLVVAASSFAAGAAIGVSWTKSEVVPVVLVKPSFGAFQPIEGNTIGISWSKDEVKPVLLVKPAFGSFVPTDGGIGLNWRKEDVIPVVLAESSVGGFSPPQSHSATDVGSSTPTSSATVIESQIDGDFEGWEGETIVRLSNGQIWKQTEYHYEYHYAFMPKVMVYKSGAGHKMKVEGTETAVGVTRLK
jgi:hypothetical protein